MAFAGEVIQERGDFLCAEVGRMAFAGEVDEAPDPVDVSFLGTPAVVLATDCVSYLVEVAAVQSAQTAKRSQAG